MLAVRRWGSAVDRAVVLAKRELGFFAKTTVAKGDDLGFGVGCGRELCQNKGRLGVSLGILGHKYDRLGHRLGILGHRLGILGFQSFSIPI